MNISLPNFWRHLTQPHSSRKLLIKWGIVVAVIAGMFRWPGADRLPNGLNWDEVAYGYNAYSLLATGADEWGARWPLFLKSFGEYKPALLSYFLMPWLVFISDPSLAIRLAAASLGTAACVGSFALAYRLSKRLSIGVLTGLWLAITPWHLHYSRTVMDPIISQALLIWGLWAWWSSSKWQQLSGAVLLVLAMYSYNATRVLVPILLLGWLLIKIPQWQQWRWHRWTSIALIVLGSLWIWAETLWGVGGSRARMVVDSSESLRSGQLMAAVTNRYLAHFSAEFLFGTKENTVQSGLGFSRSGYLLLVMLPFVVVGLLQLFALKKGQGRAISSWWLLWLAAAPLASSMTPDSPHPGRALNMLPVWQWLAASGMVFISDWLQRRSRGLWLGWAGATTALITMAVVGWWSLYLIWYPSESQPHFQGFYRQPFEFIHQLQLTHPGSYQHIYLTNYYDPPLLFYSWYTHQPPELVQQAVRRGISLDSLPTSPPVSVAHRHQRPLCLLQQPQTLLLIAPAENELHLPTMQTFAFAKPPVEKTAPPALELLLSDLLSEEERAALAGYCQ